MLNRLAENPVAKRMIRQQRTLPLHMTLLTAALIGGSSTAILIYEMSIRSPSRLRLVSIALLVLAGGLLLMAPAVTAVLSALLTVREVETVTHQLIRTTPLSRQEIVQAHITAVFFRLRWLISVALALTPVLLLGMRYYTAVFFHRMMKVTRYYYMMYDIPTPLFQNIRFRVNMLGQLPEFYGWVIGLPGILLLAVILGIGAAFRFGNRPITVAAPAFFTEALAVLLLGAIPLLPVDQMSDGVHGISVVLVAIIPYALAGWSIRLIRRWV